MKLTNLINNVWNWLKGLLIGTMVGGIVVAMYFEDEFDIGLAQDKKKKK